MLEIREPNRDEEQQYFEKLAEQVEALPNEMFALYLLFPKLIDDLKETRDRHRDLNTKEDVLCIAECNQLIKAAETMRELCRIETFGR